MLLCSLLPNVLFYVLYLFDVPVLSLLLPSLLLFHHINDKCFIYYYCYLLINYLVISVLKVVNVLVIFSFLITKLYSHIGDWKFSAMNL